MDLAQGLVLKVRSLFKIGSSQTVHVFGSFEGEKAQIDPELYPFLRGTTDRIWIEAMSEEKPSTTPESLNRDGGTLALIKLSSRLN